MGYRNTAREKKRRRENMRIMCKLMEGQRRTTIEYFRWCRVQKDVLKATQSRQHFEYNYLTTSGRFSARTSQMAGSEAHRGMEQILGRMYRQK